MFITKTRLQGDMFTAVKHLRPVHAGSMTEKCKKRFWLTLIADT